MRTTDLRDITHEIIGLALHIHSALGPGLFESVYREILADGMRVKGFDVETEKVFPLVFEGRAFRKAFRVDMEVEHQILVEVKAVIQLNPIFYTQLLTYLKLQDKRVGLLINFGEASLKVKRIANNA